MVREHRPPLSVESSGARGRGLSRGVSSFEAAHMNRLIGITAAVLAMAAPAVGHAREFVRFGGDYSAGTIVVRQSERRLYYVMGNGQAIRYPVGVGRSGKRWSGVTQIAGKYMHPAWTP